MRRTLRGSLRTAGDPIRLARRRRRVVPRRLVMLCDISGSMEPYARAYLQFLTCAARQRSERRGVRLRHAPDPRSRARCTRASPERAIQRAAAAAPDWSSGTRIGDALKAFNDRHGRRGMARGAVVVILSDGWERGDPALVGREMERLVAARAPDRVGQPARQRERLLGRAGGMVAALPHCDALVSGHSFRGAAARSSTRSARGLGEPPDDVPDARAGAADGARAVGERDAGRAAARSRCPAATARAAATRPPDG